MPRTFACSALPAGSILLVGLSLLAGSGTASADDCACNSKHPCPPKFYWFSEGPPCIKFKCACPKPVCDPCEPDPTPRS